MTGLYLYCLLPDDVVPPGDLRGVGGAPVELRRTGRLACWVSPLDGVPDPTVEEIRRHNAVVGAVLATGHSPLPVRYGQWLADEASLAERLGAGASEYLRALERVRDAVELGVRVLDPEPASFAPAELPAPEGRGAGTAYMRALSARLESERRTDFRGREIAESLRATLGSIVRAERIDALRSRNGVVSIAHLVERSGVETYRGFIHAFGHGRTDLRFFVSGPWPPYSFAA